MVGFERDSELPARSPEKEVLVKFAKTFAVFVLAAVFTLWGPMLSTGRPVASSAVQGQIAPPAPPEDSPELFRAMEFRFHPQGEQAQRHYTTYFGMMEGTEYVSKPSLGEWIPYASAEESRHRRCGTTLAIRPVGQHLGGWHGSAV